MVCPPASAFLVLSLCCAARDEASLPDLKKTGPRICPLKAISASPAL